MGFNKARAAGLFLVAGLLVNTPNSAVFAATMTVGNLTDSVADGDGCSLREAILNANGDDISGSVDCATGDGVDTIAFGLSGTILPGSSLPVITDTDMLTIDGSGRAIVLSGHNAVQVLVVSAGGVLKLQDLTITQGLSNFGGGVNVAGTGSLTVERVTFSANQANYGGAVYNLGSFTAIDSSFSGNTGYISAGAISHSGGGTAQIARCTFSENVGPLDGGAILVQGGTLTVVSSTFSANHANFGSGNGGAIYSNSPANTITIANSTFSGNESALEGSAISVQAGTVTLTDSIVANGVTGTNCSGTIIDGGGNLTFPGSSCPGVVADPMLFPLYNNGGPTLTFELQPGSPAYDSPANVFCPAVDQRGLERPLGAFCDIGSVEGLGIPGYIFFGDFELGDFTGWSTIAP